MTAADLGPLGRPARAARLVLLGAAWCLLAAGPAPAPAGVSTAAPVPAPVAVSEEAVTRVASRLRCVVCQNLSVADSPSEMARQMRDLIREQLAAGRTPAEVAQYFTDRYGEWVLLVPPARGFNLVLWALPCLGLVGGLGAVLIAARRWSRRPSLPEATDPVPVPADRERIRVELERFRD